MENENNIPDETSENSNPPIQIKLSPQEAMRAVEEVGPRVYRLTGLRSDKKFCFYAFGCHGDEGYAQGTVAELMNQMAADPNFAPDFILILGDNFYPDGVNSVDDILFRDGFYSQYSKELLDRIRKIPCFVMIGNHDGKRYKLEKELYSKFRSTLPADVVEKFQAAHSYLTQDFDPFIADKKEFYKGEAINLQEASKWNMPYTYYSLIANDTQIFCMNSNSMAHDYLEWLKYGDLVKEPNQAKWFFTEYQKAIEAGRKVIIAQHHPLFTSTKRAYDGDADLYLEPDEIAALNTEIYKDEIKMLLPYVNDNYISREESEIINELLQGVKEIVRPGSSKEIIKQLKTTYNYNKMLERIYDKAKYTAYKNIKHKLKDSNQYTEEKAQELREHLRFDVVNAHDHNINVYNKHNTSDDNKDGEYCQITSGGGGAKGLHDKKYYAEFDNTCCFMKKNGFVSITCYTNNPEFEINVYSIESYKLRLIGQDEELKKHRLYIKIYDDYIKYAVITPIGTIEVGIITNAELNNVLKDGITKKELEKYLPDILKITTARGHTKIESDHLQLTSKQMKPIREPSSDYRVNLVREIIMSEWRKYHNFLNEKQNLTNGRFLVDEKGLLGGKKKKKDTFSFLPWKGLFGGGYANLKNNLNIFVPRSLKNTTHTIQDAERIHSIINYANKRKPDDFKTMIKQIYELMDEITNKTSENSVYLGIQEHMKSLGTFGNKTLTEIYDNITRIESLSNDLLTICGEFENSLKTLNASSPRILNDITYKNDIVKYVRNTEEIDFEKFFRKLHPYIQRLNKGSYRHSLYHKIEERINLDTECHKLDEKIKSETQDHKPRSYFRLGR